MKIPDVNVLLYAVNRDSVHHVLARRWIERAFDAPAGIGFAWAALLGFVRLATRPGILASPLPVEEALQVLDAWIVHPSSTIVAPGGSHASILARLLIGAGAGGNLVQDAHLAAIAIEHGAELGTFDRDFARFAGLRCEILK